MVFCLKANWHSVLQCHCCWNGHRVYRPILAASAHSAENSPSSPHLPLTEALNGGSDRCVTWRFRFKFLLKKTKIKDQRLRELLYNNSILKWCTKHLVVVFPNAHNSDGDFLKAGGKDSARPLRTALQPQHTETQRHFLPLQWSHMKDLLKTSFGKNSTEEGGTTPGPFLKGFI